MDGAVRHAGTTMHLSRLVILHVQSAGFISLMTRQKLAVASHRHHHHPLQVLQLIECSRCRCTTICVTCDAAMHVIRNDKIMRCGEESKPC